MNYSEQLKSPMWQKKRLEIMQRDGFMCKCCLSTTKQLHVHHKYYKNGKKAWEYNDDCYVCLCSDCHSAIHDSDYKSSIVLIESLIGETFTNNTDSVIFMGTLLRYIQSANEAELIQMGSLMLSKTNKI